jgi:hypothetical protein
LRERLGDRIVRDVPTPGAEEHGTPDASALLSVHTLEPSLDALRFRTVAFDARLHRLILHVEWTGPETGGFLNNPERIAFSG